MVESPASRTTPGESPQRSGATEACVSTAKDERGGRAADATLAASLGGEEGGRAAGSTESHRKGRSDRSSTWKVAAGGRAQAFDVFGEGLSLPPTSLPVHRG